MHQKMKTETDTLVGETLDAWLRACIQRNVCCRSQTPRYCCGPVKFEPFALTLRRGSGQDLSKGSSYNLGFDKLSPNGN